MTTSTPALYDAKPAACWLRHPDVYGAVFSGSPGVGYKPTGVMPSWIPRVYLVAGTLEPFSHDSATR